MAARRTSSCLLLLSVVLFALVATGQNVRPLRTWDKMREWRMTAAGGAESRRPIHSSPNNGGDATSLTLGQVCPNTSLTCQPGCFSLLNVVCLVGTPSQYSPMVLVATGATAALLEDFFS